MEKWRHFILFAKYSYGDLKPIIPKLKIIQAHHCHFDVKYSNEFDILNILLDIIDKFFTKEEYCKMMQEMFKAEYVFDHIKTIEDRIGFLLGQISFIQYLDKDAKPLFELGEIDEKLKEQLDAI